MSSPVRHFKRAHRLLRKTPVSCPETHRKREKESSPTAEHTRTAAHTPIRALKQRNPSSGRFLSLKSGAYPTHQSCRGEVAAALSALLRFKSGAHHSSSGGGANTCHSSFQTFGWLLQQVFKAERWLRTCKSGC